MRETWRGCDYGFCLPPILLCATAPWSGMPFATALRRMAGRWRFEKLYLGWKR